MSAVVRAFGGTVVNVMGDAIIAVFGAPVAHEDDAERAVRAGLAIGDAQMASSTDPTSAPLRVHVGINTGEVVAGLVGPKERRDYTVMGDTVNTAARLLSGAATGTVLVGDPALFFRTATALLDADGDDDLAREARDTAQRIAASLPDDLRLGFERAEPVRRRIANGEQNDLPDRRPHTLAT
jgi:class 3 adenylate cyclase